MLIWKSRGQLGVTAQVRDGFLYHGDVVPETSKAVVTPVAEKSTDLAGGVVVVNMKTREFGVIGGRGLAADGAQPTLLHGQFPVLRRGEVVVSPSDGVSAGFFITWVGIPPIGFDPITGGASVVPITLCDKFTNRLLTLAERTYFFTRGAYRSAWASFKMALVSANRKFTTAPTTDNDTPWAKFFRALRTLWAVAEKFGGGKPPATVFASPDDFRSSHIFDSMALLIKGQVPKEEVVVWL
jgi:hypothetical protein